MILRISRNQIIRALRDAGWKLKDQTQRVELYGKVGCEYVPVHKRDLFTELQVRVVLSQAKFSSDAIERFLREALKS